MSTIGRWLREPVKVRHDETDWAAFGRSFGRIVGGYHDTRDDAPSSWDNSRRVAGDPTNTPRWAVLLGVGVGVGLSGGFVALVIWLTT